MASNHDNRFQQAHSEAKRAADEAREGAMTDLRRLKRQRDKLLRKKAASDRAVFEMLMRAQLRAEIRALGEDPVA